MHRFLALLLTARMFSNPGYLYHQRVLFVLTSHILAFVNRDCLQVRHYIHIPFQLVTFYNKNEHDTKTRNWKKTESLGRKGGIVSVCNLLYPYLFLQHVIVSAYKKYLVSKQIELFIAKANESINTQTVTGQTSVWRRFVRIKDEGNHLLYSNLILSKGKVLTLPSLP